MWFKKGKKSKSILEEGFLKLSSDKSREVLDSDSPPPGPWIRVIVQAWDDFESPEESPNWTKFHYLMSLYLEKFTDTPHFFAHFLGIGAMFNLSCEGRMSHEEFGKGIRNIGATLKFCIALLDPTLEGNNKFLSNWNECNEENEGDCTCSPGDIDPNWN